MTDANVAAERDRPDQPEECLTYSEENFRLVLERSARACARSKELAAKSQDFPDGPGSDADRKQR
jgi:hypothetical protein